ncbi:hypothetical protein FHR81_001622 [Actinoalloteichus hoggarensis]|uniref:hypothetical protein n=1 Tax=Actinoalloteichus hoggarensis TaxID=1470176 RepID=UPI000B8AA3F9|nr:hypothetical protein [Actinoalloteichus hoggarensis]MBB5920592.1 hypothetical protein [Actinoalloteichus hoggarensis]
MPPFTDAGVAVLDRAVLDRAVLDRAVLDRAVLDAAPVRGSGRGIGSPSAAEVGWSAVETRVPSASGGPPPSPEGDGSLPGVDLWRRAPFPPRP